VIAKFNHGPTLMLYCYPSCCLWRNFFLRAPRPPCARKRLRADQKRSS